MQSILSYRTSAFRFACLLALALLIGSRIAQLQSPVRVIKGGGGKLAFSPDGEILADSNTLWDLKGTKVKKTLKIPGSISALAFSPDGKTLATGSGGQFSGDIKLWDVQTGKFKRTLTSGSYNNANDYRGPGPVRSLAFSPNGKTIAAGIILEGELAMGGGVLLLDVRTGATVSKLIFPSYGITSLDFSDDGRFMAASCHDRKVRLCSTKTGKIIWTTPKQNNDIGAVRFVPDGKFMVSAAQDQTVKIWDVETGSILRTITEVGGAYQYQPGPHNFAISEDANTIAMSGEEQAIRFSISEKIWKRTIRKQITIRPEYPAIRLARIK